MLVFFMHAGFSMLEAGSVRFKNAQNILGKNLTVVTAGFLCWYAAFRPRTCPGILGWRSAIE